MPRWTALPRLLASGLVASGMLAALVTVSVAVVAPRPAPAAPLDRRWPGPPASLVFGPPNAPTGGSVTVGLLVPATPTRRLLDLVPPAVLAAFHAEEAAARQAADGHADLELDRPDLRGLEPFDVGFEDGYAARAREDALAAVTAAVARATGVEVAFVDVLAADAHAVPLVLVDGPVRFPGDAAALRAAVRRGTRVVRTDPAGDDVGEIDRTAVPRTSRELAPLVARCLDLVRTSPAIARLPHDPLEVVEARREGDDVVVRFRDRPAFASLRDLDDRVVAPATVAADGTVRVRCPDPALDPFRHRIVVETARPVRHRAAPSVADLVGVAERRVFAADVAERGAPFAPRILVLNSKSGAPVVGVAVCVALRQGERVLDEAALMTDAHGTVARALRVPDDAAEGPAEFVVDDQRFAIHVRSGVKLSVVTERPLYRPDDEVLVRLLAHRAAAGMPVAALAVKVKLGTVEKTVTTSAHGIGSTSFRLVDAEAGPRTLVARSGEATAQATFAVGSIELPTFTVVVAPAALTLRPDERAPITVTARYVNGAPVVGAKVTLAGHDADVDVSARTLVTDADGHAHAELGAGRDTRSSARALSVDVADADGRTTRAFVAVEVPRAADGPRVSIVAIDEPVVGRPGRVEVHSTTPGPVTVTVEGGATHRVELPPSGVAVIALVPTAAATVVRTTHRDAPAGDAELVAAVAAPGRLLVVPARRTFTVGETLAAEVLGPEGVAYVELARDGCPLLATSVRVEGGRADVAVPLAPELAGPVTLRAWRLVGDEPQGASVALLVVRGRSLVVDARPGADSWRPGETATVEVTVKDHDGRPTAGVLGYWGVDRALRALAPWPPGREEVFDVGTGADDVAAVALATEQRTPVPAASARRALGAIAVAADLARALPIRYREAPKRRAAADEAAEACADAAAARTRTAMLAVFRYLPLEDVHSATSLQEVFRALVRSGRLDAGAMRDSWGTPFVFGRRGELDRTTWRYSGYEASQAYWRSAGPDLRLTASDALTGTWYAASPEEIGGHFGALLAFLARRAAALGQGVLFEGAIAGSADPFEFFGLFVGPANNGLLGLGGGAGGAFKGRGGSRNLRAGGGGRSADEVVRLRKDFSPTLCFVPEAIVGPEGTTTLSIPLKDAVTTWDLRLVASSAGGAVGTTMTALRVTQPLHAEPWIAPFLTVGDELDLPVALRNETEATVVVRARAAVSGELALLGDVRAEVEVGPRGTGAATFRLRAVAPGSARVRVDATSTAEADAIERIVVVRPKARAQVETVHGTLSPDHPFLAALPVAAAAVYTERRASLYGSPLADVLGGFEGLIACPHG